eukprot:3819117-Pleurochrysis_carterae.AAC.1
MERGKKKQRRSKMGMRKSGESAAQEEACSMPSRTWGERVRDSRGAMRTHLLGGIGLVLRKLRLESGRALDELSDEAEDGLAVGTELDGAEALAQEQLRAVGGKLVHDGLRRRLCEDVRGVRLLFSRGNAPERARACERKGGGRGWGS